ncbi:MAG TPA: sigma-70 family RNA polymerase sigma factor [Steroidobacteraceae bacterium]
MTRIAAELEAQIVASLPRLRRFARTLTRHVADADDLVQVVVERALIKADQLRPDSSVLSWLFGIMRNAWIDETRSRRRRGRFFASSDRVEEVADASASRDEDLWSIQAAMEQLNDEQRIAVGLVLVEGLSYKEAAAVMDIPIGTLTSRLARARLTLEALLGRDTGESA